MSLRSWTRSTVRTLNSTFAAPRASRRGRRRGNSRAEYIGHRQLSEVLEQRLLLTTLHGTTNDSFEYVDAIGEIVRIRVTGNIDVEIVGASVSGLNNTAEAINLPGNLNGNDIFGGLGGPGGIDIIGPVVGLTPDPDINGLAATSDGRMFALEIQQVPVPNPPQGAPNTRNLVWLVQLDFPPVQPPNFPLPPPYGPRTEVTVTATRLAEISDEIIAESGGIFGLINTVPAADFNPANGLLYFVATGGPIGDNSGNANFDKLFTINVDSANPEATVNGIPGVFNDPGENGLTVASIAWDQTPGGPQLVALIGDDQGAGGGGGGGAGGGGSTVVSAQDPFIAVIDPTNTSNYLNTLNLTLRIPGQQGNQTQQVPPLSGIEILDEDPTGIDDLLAVGAGQSYQIIREFGQAVPIGSALQLGPLAEPVPPGGQPPIADPTGGQPTSLMFVPGMLDPFTNQLGAYVSFDTAQESNKLFFVSRFEQRPVTIYQIYVANSDSTGRIAISRVPPIDQPPPRNMTPFSGDVGGVRHVDAQNPATFPWPVSTAGSAVGQVFVGARTRDLNPNDPNDDMRPILQATIPPTLNLGLMPTGNLPIDPVTGRRIVTPGMTVNGDIDRAMIAGAITGDVIATGSINQFYCGWLLTGNALGDIAASPPSRPQNFRAGGDIRDLYVLDSLGTDSDAANNRPTYLTGFDLQAVGNVGYIRSGDSYVGAFQVRNQPEEDANIGLDIPQSEMETRTNPGSTAPDWDNFNLTGNPFFTNDTFDTAEYLGTINNLGQADMVRTIGSLQHVPGGTQPNDWVDYYAVSLLAGQAVQVTLFPEIPAILNIGVFDPDGRLIASDYSNSLDISGQTFSFTADRPGGYRFAVAASGNGNFVNAQVVNLNATIGYDMRITNVGDLAVGGVSAVNNIFDNPVFDAIAPTGGRSFLVEFGDMGSFRAGAAILSDSVNSVRVASGNLRELDGASIGFGTPAGPPDPNDPNSAGTAAALNAGVDVDIPAGSVGLVRARTGILYFMPLAPSLGRAIGGNFQVIDGAATVYVGLLADGGLGVLRAGDMQTTLASTITVNFDDTGRDGIIDLIDVVGNMGLIGAGGPAITTNTGGNVRYMRVGGQAFVDAAFGGGSPIRTLHLPGEQVTLTDDGGANLRIIPAGRTNDPTTNLLLAPNALTLRSYPIRGSGGVVVLDVVSDDSVEIDASGGNGEEGATAEIGTILITGARAIGPGVVTDPTRNVGDFTSLLDFFAPVPANITLPGAGFDPLNPGSGGGLGEGDFRRAPNPLILAPLTPAQVALGLTQPVLQVVIRGNVKTDVWSIIGADSGVDGDGQFSLISNDTDGGELVNIVAASVAQIVSNGTIGLAKPHISNTALNPVALPSTIGTGLFANIVGPGTVPIPFPTLEYPFGSVDVGGSLNPVGQRFGVWIYGDLDEQHDTVPPNITDINLLTTRLPEPGNVISILARDGMGNIAVNGNIGEINPNKDNLHNRPGIFAGIQGPIYARGNFDIGHTAFSDEGGDIYFVDIGEGITASGSGWFSRSGLYAGRRIDTVQGTDADIRGDIVAGDAQNPQDTATTTQVVNGQVVAFTRRISIPDSIGRIVLTDGSLINADVMVTTRSFESREQGIPLTSAEFSESLRQVFNELGKVEVRGNGGIIGSFFSASDVGPIDVNRGFGIFNSAVTVDADGRFAGLESDNYGIRGVSVLSGSSMNFINAQGDGSSVSTAAFNPTVRRSEPQFGALDAFGSDPLSGMAPSILTDIHTVLGTSQATPEVPGRTDTGVVEDVFITGQRDLGSLRAQQVRATSPELAPSVINFANRVGTVAVRDQINGLSMTTGRVAAFKPQGDVFNLDLTVAGPIKDLLIKGDLAEGSVIRTQGSNGKMGNIKINGRLDGDLLSSGGIKNLTVGESVSGNITATSRKGNAISKFILGGALAEGGLNVQGSIGKMVVNGSFGTTGTDFVVNGNLKSLVINGDLFSNITVAGKLNKLQVGGSIITGSTVNVGGKLGTLIIGGDLQPGATVRAATIGKEKISGQVLGQLIETA